ncbi:hypothetical protein [Sediminicola sp. YIK13]|uniref:hypothetical protein n=1 Tax=Sediminicola sp. YIK13 TaxID=1453352 RepID=UPI0012DC560D|nr:hypothetical protein [Sediminicola sp. YIK13]
MQEKENDTETKFIKEEENKTQQFILQKNSKTKIASIIITVFLVILVIGIIASGVFIG